MTKMELAAAEFCAAQDDLRAVRDRFRALKSTHSVEEGGICFVVNRALEPHQWCEECQAYPIADRKMAKRRMRNAVVRMMTQYRKVVTVAEGGEG